MDTSQVCTCKRGPGKFEGEPAEVFFAWQAALDGSSSYDFDMDGTTYSLVRAPKSPDDIDPIHIRAAQEEGYCGCCINRATTCDDAYGYLVYETNSGFVYGEEIKDESQWNAILADLETAAATAQEE